MWLSKIYLRWYKSFNTRFLGYLSDGDGRFASWDNYGGQVFPYVDIPLDRRITTVVGANESGKSHLLNAIAKVFLGKGVGTERDEAYAIHDICRYCAFEGLDQRVWPCIGIELAFDSVDECKGTLEGFGVKVPVATKEDERPRVTLILDGNDPTEPQVMFFSEGQQSLGKLSHSTFITNVKGHLPSLEYIDANMELSNEVHISQLLAMYDKQSPPVVYEPLVLQSLADTLKSLTLQEGQPASKDAVAKLTAIHESLEGGRLGPKTDAMLETLLFRDVLGVPLIALKEIAGLGARQRGYIERHVAEINHRLNERLDITHFWQQDDAFRLEVVYKAGFFYFEITDRTGVKYTFNERSSGLRFFLSYYIQAKAIEASATDSGAMVLMDEPDGFLSIAGQKNLLRVFESLVSKKTASGKCQLVYTTHSPFLINRNFPQRIRLVRKGDGSEGTQFVESSSTRRYEPVRSALGVDCADTLFMGASNVVVEGSSDQKLLVAGIQRFGRPHEIDELLDLNRVVFVSAGGASHVRRLVEKSTVGDERRPVVVVLFDGDAAGSGAYQEMFANHVLDGEFMTTLDTIVLDAPSVSKASKIEDIVPATVMANAAAACLKDRFGKVVEVSTLETALSDATVGASIADRVEQVVKTHGGDEVKHLQGLEIRALVLDSLVELLGSEVDIGETDSLATLEKNVRSICKKLSTMLELAESRARRESMHKCVRLTVERFRKAHLRAATRADVERCLIRLEGECGGTSQEARHSRENIVSLRELLEQETSDADVVVSIDKWHSRLSSFKDRPWTIPTTGWK